MLQINTNLSQGADVSASSSVLNAIRTIQIGQLAETQDVELIAQAVAACAQRDVARAQARFGSNTLQAVATQTKLQRVQQLTEVLHTSSGAQEAHVLSLLQ